MATETTSHFTHRYWMLEDPPKSLWPFGFLMLGLLLLLFLWGLFITSNNIENDVALEVSTQLNEALGDGWEVKSVTVSGQQANVDIAPRAIQDSTAPDQSNTFTLNDLQHIGEATRCDTLFGAIRCPTTVVVNRVQAALPAALIPAASPAASKAAPQPQFHNFDINTAKGRERHTLSAAGDVPNAALLDEITQRSTNRYTLQQFEFKETGKLAYDSYSLAFERALELLQSLTRGEARWQNGALSISGLTNEANLGVVQQRFASLDITTGKLDLEIEATAAACNDQLAELLQNNTINFATNSADLVTDSLPLIDALANAASTCPGSLIVEGHTDSSGIESNNQVLSEARANAVRRALIERGMAGARLRASGLGSAQPVASNATVSGRAQNRRIVIKVEN